MNRYDTIHNRIDCVAHESALRLPISPLELDSVKLGVPSVHVGVDPSFDAGGVHASAPREPYWLPVDVSTAKCGSNRISDMLHYSNRTTDERNKQGNKQTNAFLANQIER